LHGYLLLFLSQQDEGFTMTKCGEGDTSVKGLLISRNVD